MWDSIAQQIAMTTGQPVTLAGTRSVGGGCINQGYRLTDKAGQSYFVKVNQASQVAMFEAELLGLRQMHAVQAIRVPRPICVGVAENSCYLVMEWLALEGSAQPLAWRQMGEQLARLHRLALSDRGFGWEMNNTIGSTPQLNAWTETWAAFWAEQRIGYQLKLAERRGGQFPRGKQLLAAIPDLLAGWEPEPSLVHGDLWSGNAAISATGEPVIFDPAVYYGDREVDLAMTELFGGFPSVFYQGYEAIWPLDRGYQRRKTLYNLYHVLNHFNLFGGGYGGQANRMIEELVR